MAFSQLQKELPTLEQRLVQIRTALAELTEIQNQLKKNASSSKSSIQSTFSRQLETLRTREVYLLSQVETLLQVKQDHLQLQAEGLQRELGALEALLDSARASGKAVSLQDVENIMKRFQHVQLSHEEDALLGFEGDPKELKKAILSFGYVTAKRRRVDKDSDRNCMSEQIIGGFEQFAGRQVWLCKVKKSEKGVQDGRPRMVFPVFLDKGDCQAWLFKEDSDCDTSMDSSASPSDGEESFVMVSEHPSNIKETSSHFARILTSPDIQWIRPASRTANVGVSPHQQRKSFSFYRPGGSTKDWVRQPSAQTQEKNTRDTSTTNLCTPDQVLTKQIEIEDLADLACVQDTPSGAPSPCSPKGSQQEEERNTTTCCSTPTFGPLRVKSSDAVNISDVCKGNEKCNTFAECLCEENCADSFKRGSAFSGFPESSKNLWLVKTPPAAEKSDVGESSEPIVVDKEMPKADFVKEWLASKTSPPSETGNSVSSIVSSFMKWQLEKNPSWVKKPTNNIYNQQQQENDDSLVNEWLVKKTERSGVVDNRKIFEEEKQHSQWLFPKSPVGGFPAFKRSFDTTSWLLKEDQGTSEGSGPITKEESLQEKWLFKQVPGKQGLTNKPGFSEFAAPMDVSQWLKT